MLAHTTIEKGGLILESILIELGSMDSLEGWPYRSATLILGPRLQGCFQQAAHAKWGQAKSRRAVT
jgi:hypothetical protein